MVFVEILYSVLMKGRSRFRSFISEFTFPTIFLVFNKERPQARLVFLKIEVELKWVVKLGRSVVAELLHFDSD